MIDVWEDDDRHNKKKKMREKMRNARVMRGSIRIRIEMAVESCKSSSIYYCNSSDVSS